MGTELDEDVLPDEAGLDRAISMTKGCYTGQEIVAPEALQSIAPDLVLVMNPVYLDEIRATVHGMGLRPRVEAL